MSVKLAMVRMRRQGVMVRPTCQAMSVRIDMVPALMMDGVQPTTLMKNSMKRIEKKTPANLETLPKILREISTRIARWAPEATTI